MPFVSLGLVPEFASSLLVPQLRGPRAAPPSSCCWASRSTAPTRSRWASPTRCCRRAEVVNHARRMAERFNALPPGAVRESKALMRRGRRRRWSRRSRSRARSSASACAAPRRRRRSGLLPEAQARLLEVLIAARHGRGVAPGGRARRQARARAAAGRARRSRRAGRALELPEAAGAARGQCAAPTAAARAARADRRRFVGGRRGRGTQDEAFAGQLVRALHERTGGRSAGSCARHRPDGARRARALAGGAAARRRRSLVVIAGVNDVVDQATTRRAVRDLAALDELAARARRRRATRACGLAADGSLPAAAAAAALGPGPRRRAPGRRAGALGGDAQLHLLACPSFVARSSTPPADGERRLPSRRAGLSACGEALAAHVDRAEAVVTPARCERRGRAAQRRKTAAQPAGSAAACPVRSIAT